MVFTACARTTNTASAGHASGSGSSSGGGGGGDNIDGDGGGVGTARAENGPGPGPPLSLQEALLNVYSEVFLEGPICSTLLVHNKYPMSVAADTVVRVLLSELFLLHRQVRHKN